MLHIIHQDDGIRVKTQHYPNPEALLIAANSVLRFLRSRGWEVSNEGEARLDQRVIRMLFSRDNL